MFLIPLMLMLLFVVLAGSTCIVATKTKSWVKVILIMPLVLLAFWSGKQVAKKEDDGFFNYAVGWPFVRLTERLDALAQGGETQVLTNQLHFIKQQSFSIFPNSVRRDREFEKLVDQVLRETKHLITTNTEPNIGQVSPEAAPSAAPDEPSM